MTSSYLNEMHDVIGVNLFLRKLRIILSLPHYLMESYNARETTILDKNLETLWKILLPFVFPLPFAMLL